MGRRKAKSKGDDLGIYFRSDIVDVNVVQHYEWGILKTLDRYSAAISAALISVAYANAFFVTYTYYAELSGSIKES